MIDAFGDSPVECRRAVSPIMTTGGSPYRPRWDPVPYELRIGVAGHRHLDDPGGVTAAVKALLAQVMQVLDEASRDPFGPHGSPRSRTARFDRRVAEVLAGLTRPLAYVDARMPAVSVSPRRPESHQRTPVKLTAISSLARGADQIVARVICDVVREQPLERNRYLEAVLPMPQEIYEQDFTAPEELQEFRALLALDCGAANTHPEPTVCCPSFPSAPETGTLQLTRQDAYAAAGRHVVDTSEVLVAIWDPSRNGGPGGTEQIVREALERGRLVLWLNPSRLGDGAWLLEPAPAGDAAPRPVTSSADARVPPPAPRGCIVSPVPTRAKHLSPNCHRLAAYNRDNAVSMAALTVEWSRQSAALAEHARRGGLDDVVTRTLIERLLPRFVRADLLSRRYRSLRDAAGRIWPGSAALVVTVMAFQIVFLPSHYWLAWVELGVLMVGYASNRVSLHEAWHEKWLSDRRLAEGLRSAIFAALAARDADAGVTGASRGQALLPFYDPATAWYVASMKREVAKGRREFPRTFTLDDPVHRDAVKYMLKYAWILPQATHHRQRADQRHHESTSAARLRLGLFSAIVLVAIAHALGVGHHETESGDSFGRIDAWLGFVTIVLPAWAAAFHVMFSLDDRERLGKRSIGVARLLDGVAERLASAQTVEELRARVAEAERLMDLESTEWAESMVDRRPEFTV
jgi:hypothetical protein